jgi:dienelactone hydrolase
VVLTFELRGFGMLGRRVGAEHRIVAYNTILAGSSYKAAVLKDMKQAVDLLLARKEVDPARFGVAGTSLGGETAVTYAALDLRVKAAVIQAYGGSVGATPGDRAHAEEDQPHYCHTIPGQNRLMHEQDVFLLVAPRPMLVVRGTRDAAISPQFRTELERAYVSGGSRASLSVRTLDGGHEFFVEPAMEFLAAAFRGSAYFPGDTRGRAGLEPGL